MEVRPLSCLSISLRSPCRGVKRVVMVTSRYGVQEVRAFSVRGQDGDPSLKELKVKFGDDQF